MKDNGGSARFSVAAGTARFQLRPEDLQLENTRHKLTGDRVGSTTVDDPNRLQVSFNPCVPHDTLREGVCADRGRFRAPQAMRQVV